jgi:hypothetical protein
MPDLATRTLIPENQRVKHTARLFGADFPWRLEPTVYALAGKLSPAYAGGYWHFYTLDNDAFYMAPAAERPCHLTSPNGYHGELSPEAFGIVICLLAYSHLCFGHPSAFTETCAEQFHRLRRYALGHAEAKAILAAID